MRRDRLFILTIVAITPFLCSCASKLDRPPEFQRPFGEEFQYCEKCGSLKGGSVAKGPIKEFAGAGKESCIHEWQEITPERFKQLATELHGCDWSQEAPFFRDDWPQAPPPVEQMHDLPLMTPEDSYELEQP
ncbi:hypothetical protein Pan258_00190 [Symmachiella dynata]|uniref:hypothetical protein n=1 Tax=Symmachiella dynata TaxID=2527995 RepID=UPI0011885577|nr:hypothetical protein [Symmachiella dynata]QDT46002.1 hypothetical protein Pan258_00190 [Symmachiella dynata]